MSELIKVVDGKRYLTEVGKNKVRDILERFNANEVKAITGYNRITVYRWRKNSFPVSKNGVRVLSQLVDAFNQHLDGNFVLPCPTTVGISSISTEALIKELKRRIDI